MSNTATSKTDFFDEVTNSIIQLIEAGTLPWYQPWQNQEVMELPYNPSTGNDYQGINTLNLWSCTIEKGFLSNRWMTFNQAKKLGGTVRKGEKSTSISVAKDTYKKTEMVNPQGITEEVTTKYTFFKCYRVFNLDQLDFPEDSKPELKNQAKPYAEIENVVDQLIYYSGAQVIEGSNKAFFSPLTGRITMPHRSSFASLEKWQQVLLHELVHWSGSRDQLDRSSVYQQMQLSGDDEYAFEELVAEIGSAFLSCKLGVEGGFSHLSPAYLVSWLKVLKADNSAIFRAASMARQAVDYILAFLPLEQKEQIEAA